MPQHSTLQTKPTTDSRAPASDYKIPQVIAASAVGTMIEWYDFYIFGSLATVISPRFYPAGDDTLCAYRVPFDFRRGLCRSSVWSALLRTHRRSGRTQVRI